MVKCLTCTSGEQWLMNVNKRNSCKCASSVFGIHPGTARQQISTLSNLFGFVLSMFNYC